MDTTNTALIVIDVQESFRHRPDWLTIANPDIAEPVSRLVDAARHAGHLVVWVLHSEPGSGGVFDPVSGHVRLQAGLQPTEDEPTLVKTSVNAFTTTNLQQHLTATGVRHVIICGIRTEQCCETTARVASDLGYQVSFVTDATTTSAIRSDDGTVLLDAPAIVERTERILAGREFATITTTDEVVDRYSVMAG
jgi:nicotinamidase-related amidase